MSDVQEIKIESHPWQPWLPADARVLFMGTFPPGSHRWSMDFYYPNPTNDFWRIMSLLLIGDKDALYDTKARKFDLGAIKRLTADAGIAMSDTVKKARRLKGNASDKFLEVVEANDPAVLVGSLPLCTDVATTGEKAAEVIAAMTGTLPPKMGEYSVWNLPDNHTLRIWRMPSTSRAYPLKLERKAAYYRVLLETCGII